MENRIRGLSEVFTFAVAVLCLWMPAGAAWAGGFQFEILPVDAVSPLPFDINNRGMVVGADVATGEAFFYHRGETTKFTVPGARITEAWGLNNRGDVIGRVFYEPGGAIDSWVLDRRGFRPVVVPGASETHVFEIDDRGRMIGFYRDDTGLVPFMMDRKGEITLLEELPGLPSALNNRGDVAGITDGVSLPRAAYVWSAKRGTATYAVPGKDLTEALGSNSRGQVVGDAFNFPPLEFDRVGYLRQPGGRLLEMVFPEATDTTATGISDRARIVGQATSPSCGTANLQCVFVARWVK